NYSPSLGGISTDIVDAGATSSKANPFEIRALFLFRTPGVQSEQTFELTGLDGFVALHEVIVDLQAPVAHALLTGPLAEARAGEDVGYSTLHEDHFHTHGIGELGE